MSDKSTTEAVSAARFNTTLWSVVLAAKDSGTTDTGAAFDSTPGAPLLGIAAANGLICIAWLSATTGFTLPQHRAKRCRHARLGRPEPCHFRQRHGKISEHHAGRVDEILLFED
jgi:hypothetical protein